MSRSLFVLFNAYSKITRIFSSTNNTILMDTIFNLHYIIIWFILFFLLNIRALDGWELMKIVFINVD